MHHAENYHHHSKFSTEELDPPAQGIQISSRFQKQRNEADVDQVKPNHQQVVDRIRQFPVSLKRVDQKDSAVLM